MFSSIGLRAAGLALALAGSGLAHAEVRKVEGLDFDRVQIFGSVRVEISQGDEPLLQLRGDSEDLDRKPFYMAEEDTLVLGRSEDDDSDDLGDIKYKLSVNQLTHLELVGSGEAYVKPLSVADFYATVEGSGDIKFFALQGDNITLQVSGSGDIQVADVEAKSLQLIVAGSGDINLGKLNTEALEVSLNGSGDIGAESGAATDLKIHIVGSGDVDLGKVDAHACEINIIGSGTARIGDTENMAVRIMGSGDVSHRGAPEISQSVMGSGEIHSRD